MTNKLIDVCFKVARKYGPEILVGIGIGGVITGTVVACKETKNVDPILEEHDEQMNAIHSAYENGEIIDEETQVAAEYTEKDMRRDTALTYFKTFGKLAKNYLGSGLIICGSIACILGSHRILRKENLGLVAYAGLVSDSYNKYRKNIIETFGEEADIQARHNVKEKKVKAKKGEDQEKVYIKTDLTDEIDHSRFFDHESKFWDKSVTMNLMNINSVKKGFNLKLKTRRSHTVTLNEVYDALDLRPSEDGQVVGFRWRPGVDPVDENGLPMVIDFSIIKLEEDVGMVKKNISDVLSTGEIIEPVMLLDPIGLEVIVPRALS